VSWNDVSPKRREAAERILTPRQLAVVQRRMDGHSWRQIGFDLDLDPATVRGHWERALDRLRKESAR
jgi:DNA-binding NarL/FixJ family response regulator